MDKIEHLMAEKNKNNKDSQKEQVTPKKYLKKIVNQLHFDSSLWPSCFAFFILCHDIEEKSCTFDSIFINSTK
jgi:hypothetical protein